MNTLLTAKINKHTSDEENPERIKDVEVRG